MDESYCINLCSHLGTVVHGKFVRNEGKCLKSLKRIRRELNADAKDETNSALLVFGDVNILRGYLIPLAKAYGARDQKMLVEATKVVVQLTMPLGVGDTVNRSRRMRQLRLFKADFLTKGALHAFFQLIDLQDKQSTELVLWVLRNLLTIPDASPGSGPGATKDAHLTRLHEDFLEMLHRESILDYVLHIAEFIDTDGNKEWNLILLEIFYHLFRGLRVDELFEKPAHVSLAAAKGGKLAQQHLQNDRLASMMVKRNAKRVQARQGTSSRHGKFSGRVQLGAQRGILKHAFAASQAKSASLAGELVEKSLPQARRSGTGPKKGASQEELALHSQEMTQKAQENQILGFTSREKTSTLGLSARRLYKELCASLVDKCYSVLYTSLKKDFSRADARLLRTDHIQFIWLAGFCIGFERRRVEERGDQASFRWDKSPVMKTLDAWTFFYVIRACEMNKEDKRYRELEISVRTMSEMIHYVANMQASGDESVLTFVESLRNRFFHEFHTMEIFPQLIREWNGGLQSFAHLADLTALAGAMTRIMGKMAEDSVVVSMRARGGKKKKGAAEAARAKPWSAEETNALAEAVRAAPEGEKGNSKWFRRALKDPALKEIFDPSRTASAMVERWKQIEAHMKEHKTDSLEAFLAQEAANEPGEFAANEEEELKEERLENLQRAKQEKILEMKTVSRPYTNNGVLKNMCLVLDPARIPASFPLSVLSKLHEEVLPDFLERVDEESPGMLWHLQFFAIFARALEAYPESTRPRLHRTLRKVLGDFFSHASQNTLTYLEIFFYRSKTENELMFNQYEDRDVRRARIRAERIRKEDEEVERLRKERMGEDYISDEFEVLSDSEQDESDQEADYVPEKKEQDGGGSGEKRKKKKKANKLRRKRPRAPSESDGEAEADLNQIGFVGDAIKRPTRKRNKQTRAAVTSAWGHEETESLVRYVRALGNSERLDLVQVALAAEETLDLKKPVDDIKEHLRRLRLVSSIQRDLYAKATGAISLSSPEIKLAAERCLKHPVGEALVWISEQLAANKCVLVPIEDVHFEALKSKLFINVLVMLGYSRHGAYWRIPATRAKKIASDFDSLLKMPIVERDETERVHHHDESPAPKAPVSAPYFKKWDVLF